MNCINLAQDSDKWRAPVSTVMKFCVILDRKPVIKLQVPYTVVNFAN
jgi:hypothetical protein